LTLYVDAAILVAAITSEPLTTASRAILADSGMVVASTWTMVEATSGLAKKVRTGDLTEDELEMALGKLDLLTARYLPLISLDDGHMGLAARYTARARLGLRAGDALHVAVAASLSAMLVTSDVVMARAAEGLGVPVRLLA
jgi:hypothetical protein